MVHGQTIPRAADRYHRLQQLEVAAVRQAVRRAWSRVSVADIAASWNRVSGRALTAIQTGQARTSARVPGYMSAVLQETASAAQHTPFGQVNTRALIGFAGDGRELDTLLDLAPIQAKSLIAKGVAPTVALMRIGFFLDRVVETVVPDTYRQVEVVEMASRDIGWYVRAINVGACNRCAILAGRRYRSSVAFDRHDLCQCIHIPVGTESEWESWQLDSQEYFDSLSRAEQDRIFTNAGAEAIRNGADPALVVNARRGMYTAAQNQRGWIPKGRLVRTDVYGQRVYTTTEATTRRGSASRRRTGRRGNVRLMPESIVELAEGNREELLRLLRLHGYLA